jgi:hypothetical protein
VLSLRSGAAMLGESRFSVGKPRQGEPDMQPCFAEEGAWLRQESDRKKLLHVVVPGGTRRIIETFFSHISMISSFATFCLTSAARETRP